MTDMQNFNEKIIKEFRANNGQVAMFADYPMIILHTIGRNSGKTFLVPLVLTIKEVSCCLLHLQAQRNIQRGCLI